MKKKIIILTLFTLTVKMPYACDICGCGVGNYYIGILPTFKKNLIGVRYQTSALYSHLQPDGSFSYLTTKERFHIAEILGAVNVGKRFRVMGLIPWNFIARYQDRKQSNKSGLGDMAFLGHYQVLQKRTQFHEKIHAHALWMGAGMKLPTGKYQDNEKNVQDNLQNSFQLGTGSVDFMLNLMHDFRIMDLGVNTNITYKINTKNKAQYQYGNKFTLNTQFYYKVRSKKGLGIAPNTGIIFESSEKDWNNLQIVDVSGGKSLLGTIGLESTMGNISWGVNWQTPLYQQLALGSVEGKNRLMMHLSFTL
jgi:hypothetical protein